MRNKMNKQDKQRTKLCHCRWLNCTILAKWRYDSFTSHFLNYQCFEGTMGA